MAERLAPWKISSHIAFSIDCIRGLACTGVIFGHAYDGTRYAFELNGGFWVWVFFVLSGYLVGNGFLTRRYEINLQGISSFLLNRGLRVLPLAYIALLLSLLMFSISATGVPSALIRQFLFIPVSNQMTLLGPLWSVAVELQYYLLSILFLPVLSQAGPMLRTFILIALWSGSVHLSPSAINLFGDNPDQPRTLLGNLPFFIFGFLIAAIKPIRVCQSGTIKVIGVFVLVSLATYLNNYLPGYFWHTGGAVVASCLVAIIVLVDAKSAFGEGRAARLLLPMRWCGVYCYGIYVWHAVIGTANYLFFKFESGLVMLTLLAFSIPLASVSYRFIEEPFLGFKRTSQLRN